MPGLGCFGGGHRAVAGDVARLARMAIQLRPAQAGQRLRLRGQRAVLDRWPASRRWLLAGPSADSAVGWPAAFTPLDARTWPGWPGRTLLREGAMSLLGVTRALATDDGKGAVAWAKADWEARDAPLLWRYHLHYWDWAWALAAPARPAQARALFAAMWSSWRAAVSPGTAPAWHPYPAALRAWSFCGLYRALVAGGPDEALFRADLAVHAGFLRRNLETDVGGNHLIKDLKALAGLAVWFADDQLLAAAIRRLRRQVAIQVLPDGGHYERAPAYHCQVLGDLLDLAGLLQAAGHGHPAWLDEATERMRDWLGAVLTPQGDVPLLNDGFPVSGQLLAAVRPTAPPARPLHVLPGTGLVRAAVGGWHVLADIGAPCPRELPAHAHADTLGFLLHVDGEPLLIDTATSSYEAGPARDRERSTAAHNTVQVDRRDSTEVWGAFRAGRRARVHDASAGWCEGAVTVEAAHDGYRSLPGRPRHHRRWTLDAEALRVDDTVSGRGRHEVMVRWHLAPETRSRLAPGGAILTTRAGEIGVTVTASAPFPAARSPLTIETGQIAVGFGQTVRAPVLACTIRCDLPVRISTSWRRAGHG